MVRREWSKNKSEEKMYQEGDKGRIESGNNKKEEK